MTTTINAQCSMSCNNGLRVSIAGSPDCNAMITPEMMLANPSSCPGIKIITITNEFGQTLPQVTRADGSIISVVGVDNIGQTLSVKVAHSDSGNSCWGNISVEDKIAPWISDCDPVSIFCFQNTAPVTEGGIIPVPTAVDCSFFTSSYSDEFVDEDCEAAVSARINREWMFIDAQGNTSTCIQEIKIERIALADYTPICPSTYTLECNTANMPSVSPNITGFPYIDVDGNPFTTDDMLILDNTQLGFCELGVSYSDETVELCGNSAKIIRTWSVFDWCAPTQIGINPWTCIQLIKIDDTTAPEITPISDFTVGTSSNTCIATLTLPTIEVNDNCSETITVTTITPLGNLNSNGGVLPFPGLTLGDHTISYVATDACGNSSTYNLTVTVEDQAPPVVICNSTTRVALQPDGTAIIYAEAFDDGSFDNCGIAGYEVRRMAGNCGPESAFGPYATFTCCDIENGPVTVAMQVTDIHGNTNHCMVSVEVQDKIHPLLACPVNQHLDCQDDWLNLELTGMPIVSDACGIDTTYFHDFGRVDECGFGDIQRVWTIIDRHGNSATCTQWIYITNQDPFTEDDIQWPMDYTTNTCGNGLEPENLSTPYDQPNITEGFCDLVAVTHQDTYLPITAPACYKILRRWLVVDWCKYDPNAANPEGYYEYNQFINVLNSEVPEFTSGCTNQSFCNYEADCGPTLVTLNVSGIDDCTPNAELNFSYKIDLNDDGIIDRSGDGNVFQGNIAIGTHSIEWYLEDGCGNVSTCEYLFVVEDCKKPTPYCLNGIATNLMSNTANIATWASDLDAGSFDNCGIAEYRIVSPSLGVGQEIPPVGSSNSIVFDCDDLGLQSIDFWVLDIHGNWAYCITDIDIQDNNQVCYQPLELSVSGYIENEKGTGLANTKVTITGNDETTVFTSADGNFIFPALSGDDNYTLRPEKDGDYLNGVTTFDMVLISRHILGINALNSPYKLVAADINKSGSVTTFDLVHLRRTILQLNEGFPNNQSWRFIEADFVFPNPENPFQTSFPESIAFNGLEEDAMADFVAIKVGDVNNNASTSLIDEQGEARKQERKTFWTEDQEFTADEWIEVDIYAKDFQQTNGFQYALDLDEDFLSFAELEVDSSLKGFGPDNYSWNQRNGRLMISWHDPKGISISPEKRLFRFYFKSKGAGRLSEALKVSFSDLKPELYQELSDGSIENSSLDLVYRTKKIDDFELLTNKDIVLEQNEPNPFRGQTSIPFFLPEETMVQLTIFDLSGKIVWQERGGFKQGWNQIELEATTLQASGLLYYQLQTATFSKTRKMMRIQ